jgi:hypothetical protein
MNDEFRMNQRFRHSKFVIRDSFVIEYFVIRHCTRSLQDIRQFGHVFEVVGIDRLGRRRLGRFLRRWRGTTGWRR